MSEQFTPRTLAIVAVASLVMGFVVVFGGGMLLYRQSAPSQTANAAPSGPTPVVPVQTPAAETTTDTAAPSLPVPLTADADVGLPSTVGPLALDPTDGDGGSSVAAGTVTVAPGAISRCFDQTVPAVIPGAHCDALTALDQHFQSRASQIASCGRGHGHLAFIMDFRFSTSFVRAWGGPTSTIPNAGIVAACVRRVTAPLPLAQVTHAHDRYITAYGIDW